MGDLSENFSRHEWKCRCCWFDTVDSEIITVLQKHVRDYYKKKVTVSGGNRCRKRNRLTKGASPNSRHMQGKAADIKVEGVLPVTVYEHLNKLFPSKYGLGLYNNRIHLDVDKKKRRWDKRSTV